MSVAVQVVNGREQGTEEEEIQEAGGVAPVAMGGAQAMETKEEELAPSSPREDVMSDSELDQTGAPKKKRFKAWKSIKKIFKKKKSSKGSESDSSQAPNKSKSKSTGELEIGGDEEGELNKRISMSEDSVFTPDKSTSAKDRNSYSLNTSNLADEISAKLKERASSSDDGYAQSSEDAMGDTTHDNSYVAPSDSSKTDSGIITTEDEKSFTSTGVKDRHHVTAEMKRLKKDNPGDVDLDLIQTSKLLSSSAAKHRISVAPSNRRPSKKARARTPQKRSSSRLDDVPSPIAEEPTTPSNSPAPFNLDNEEKGDTPKNEGVPVVIIESPSSDDLKISRDSTLEDAEEEEDEEPMILPPVPKEVIIIMKDDPKKDPEAEAKPTTPTTPEPPTTPLEAEAPEEDVPASPPPTEMKKKEEVEKESSETEKDVEEIKKKEEEDAAIVEERRLSVAASKALFEAKIPASEPVKSTSSNKVVVNGNGTSNTNARRSSQPTETVPETKAEADNKLSEKEEKKDEEEGEKDEAVFSDKEENLEMEESKEEPVSLRDRISRYQSLATKTPVKGLTSHVPSRNSPTKQRPASTSNIENKDSPKKIAPKVLSKPSSTSSNKPSGSTATTIEPSRPSTNPTPSSTSTSTTRKPLQPKIDRCMVCDKPVYPNEMSKFEGRVFHRTCQKCSECSRSLTLWNLDIAEDRLYCKQHGTVAKNNQLKEKLII